MDKNTSVPMDKHTINLCVQIRKKYFGEDTRPSTGMCMIVFAIPLLIPGIVITCVAFQDETGFSRFSGLHVFGMVLLAADILLLLVGIALCIRFQSKVVPDDAFHAMSSHKKIRKEVDLDIITTKSTIDPPPRGIELSAQCHPSIPPLNYFLDKDHSKTNLELSPSEPSAFSSIYQQNVPEVGYLKTSLENDSSSDESYESDNCSSGSYIVDENMLADRTAQAIGSERDLNEVQKSDLNFRNIATTLVITESMRSNNFFQSSTTNCVPDIQENVTNVLTNSNQSNTVLKTHNRNIQHGISSHINEHEIVPVQGAEQATNIHNTNCSPTSRRRLLGFSSESVLTSPKTTLDSNISLAPSKVIFSQHTLSLEENIADSRSSVFSAAAELKDMRIKHQNNTGKKQVPLWYSERKPHGSNTQHAVRPISFPSGDGWTRSTNPSTTIKKSSSQNQHTRSQSTEGYLGSTSNVADMMLSDL